MWCLGQPGEATSFIVAHADVRILIVEFYVGITKMETLLEQQRRYHEERERLTDAMVKELLHPKKTVSLYCKEIMHVGVGWRASDVLIYLLYFSDY